MIKLSRRHRAVLWFSSVAAALIVLHILVEASTTRRIESFLRYSNPTSISSVVQGARTGLRIHLAITLLTFIGGTALTAQWMGFALESGGHPVNASRCVSIVQLAATPLMVGVLVRAIYFLLVGQNDITAAELDTSITLIMPRPDSPDIVWAALHQLDLFVVTAVVLLWRGISDGGLFCARTKWAALFVVAIPWLVILTAWTWVRYASIEHLFGTAV